METLRCMDMFFITKISVYGNIAVYGYVLYY